MSSVPTNSDKGMVTNPPMSNPASRTEWVDVAKGIGIVLVVFGHAVIGIRDARLIGAEHALVYAKDIVYMFHMPLFFFLSGLFIEKRIVRDRKRVAVDSLKKIAWPYFLWSIIQAVVIVSMGNAVNTPYTFTPSRLLYLPVEPVSQFWFFNTLFLAQWMVILLLPIGGRGLLCLGIIMFGCAGNIQMPLIVMLLAKNFVYFAFGLVFAEKTTVLSNESNLRLPLFVSACVGFTYIGNEILTNKSVLPNAIILSSAIAGCTLFVCLSLYFQGSMKMIFSYLGKESLGIFILHIFFTAGLRILATRIYAGLDPYSLCVIAVFGGIVGPVVIVNVLRRVHVARYLGFS